MRLASPLSASQLFNTPRTTAKLCIAATSRVIAQPGYSLPSRRHALRVCAAAERFKSSSGFAAALRRNPMLHYIVAAQVFFVPINAPASPRLSMPSNRLTSRISALPSPIYPVLGFAFSVLLTAWQCFCPFLLTTSTLCPHWFFSVLFGAMPSRIAAMPSIAPHLQAVPTCSHANLP